MLANPFKKPPKIITHELPNVIIKEGVTKFKPIGAENFWVAQENRDHFIIDTNHPKITAGDNINWFRDLNDHKFTRESSELFSKEFLKGLAMGAPFAALGGVVGGVVLDRWLFDPHHTSDDTSQKDDQWPR